MGKAKKARSGNSRGVSSPTARPFNSAEITASNALRESKILPVVRNLGSANSKQRLEAVYAINNLLQDVACRRLLLKERVVLKLMEETLNDSNEEVAVYGWGALRNIAAEGGYDQSIFMYRKDILTPAAVAVRAITLAIGNVTKNPLALQNSEKKLLWQYAENVLGLITSLWCFSKSGASQEVVDAITKLDILHFIMGLLDPSAIIPGSVQEAAAQCLHALTEDNDTIAEKIVTNRNYLSILMQLVNDTDVSACLKTIFICGSLHNISLAATGLDEEVVCRISDSVILPVLTNIGKSMSSSQELSGDISLTPLPLSADQRILAVQTALEVLASIATAVQGDTDGGFEVDEGGDVELIDEDGTMKGEEREGGDDVDGRILQDMEMVTGGESNGEPSLLPSSEDIIQYLIGTTSPILLEIARSGPGTVLAVRVLALSVLNNISWTVNATIPQESSLWLKWEKLAHEIWESCVTPILLANTADVELADVVTGLSWAVAKTLKGGLDVSRGQHQAFINLYHATNSSELQTKCVGVLGCLGLPQRRIEVNKEIGVFMMTLIAGTPNTPPGPAVEALNAIFDIYADAEFDYDEPVFVKNGFLAHLSRALPDVRTTAKRVDKKKFPEDRHRADEAVLNLQRFIQYKTKERKSLNQ